MMAFTKCSLATCNRVTADCRIAPFLLGIADAAEASDKIAVPLWIKTGAHMVSCTH